MDKDRLTGLDKQVSGSIKEAARDVTGGTRFHADGTTETNAAAAGCIKDVA